MVQYWFEIWLGYFTLLVANVWYMVYCRAIINHGKQFNCRPSPHHHYFIVALSCCSHFLSELSRKEPILPHPKTEHWQPQ